MKIWINNKEYEAELGESVLSIALRNKIDIPHFCYHEDLPTGASCRTCLVEIEDMEKIVTSCTLKAKDGLRVSSETEKVKRLRLKNLELLLANHYKNCPKCQQGLFCQVAKEAEKYGASMTKYDNPEKKSEICSMGGAIEFDPRLCIACNKCVAVCKKLGLGILEMKGKNIDNHATANQDPNTDCIYCGQCAVHCPVGAIREKNEIEIVERALNDDNKIVIAQMAPSVRASIGEEFGLPVGTDLTGQTYTAFRKLGFDKVFDVNMGADITTIIEAEELIERINHNENLPMFTSCCPAWVKFVEFYHPEIIDNLTTARSPQIHAGAAYKTWWAKKEGVNPNHIVVVSIMPCTSKKYEAHSEKFKIDGLSPVDHVLTTREFATLLKKQSIDITNLDPSEVDTQGTFSGAGAIFGASGGVMESALRTAYNKITGKDLEKLEFEEVRGIEGIKRASIKIGEKTLNVAVVSAMTNAKKIIKEMNNYDYIEVMACPGGCIGGGGQPIPTTLKITKERAKSLYNIDSKMKMRNAHENPIVKDFFDNLPDSDREKILYTTYSRKNKFE